MTHPFYFSKFWKQLRSERLRLDNFRCAVAGCKERASVVDHIVARLDGGSDNLNNLRSLCSTHDKKIKERSDRSRGMSGRLPSVCDENGMPCDPGHPWYRRGAAKKS
jgi:5-methylcytosine-specific restriction endonuclease McrA